MLGAATATSGSNSMVEYVTALTGDTQPFNQPLVSTRDAQGNLYVAEISNQILKYNKAGKFTTKWGSLGSGDGQFSFGTGNNIGLDIAIDSSGNVFVTDGANNRVQKFDPNGKFLAKWGKGGTGDGEFDLPGGLAVDPTVMFM
jgi:tripartite motif-containing protein 71